MEIKETEKLENSKKQCNQRNKIMKIQKQSKQKNHLRLALDIGTNSIGWAIYNLSKEKKPISIAGTGVRIFSSGRKDKDYTTLNATTKAKKTSKTTKRSIFTASA